MLKLNDFFYHPLVSPLPSSVRHPVLHLSLWQRWCGCDWNRVPQGAVPVNSPGIPTSAGPREGDPQQDSGQTDAQAGRQRLPVLLRGESLLMAADQRLTDWMKVLNSCTRRETYFTYCVFTDCSETPTLCITVLTLGESKNIQYLFREQDVSEIIFQRNSWHESGTWSDV